MEVLEDGDQLRRIQSLREELNQANRLYYVESRPTISDREYDKLMQEANTYGQPIDSVVDLFIAVCTTSGECNP